MKFALGYLGTATKVKHLRASHVPDSVSPAEGVPSPSYPRVIPRTTCNRGHPNTAQHRSAYTGDCLSCARMSPEDRRPDARVQVRTAPLLNLVRISGHSVKGLTRLYATRLNMADRTAMREWAKISNEDMVSVYIADRWCSVLGFPLGFLYGDEAYVGCEEEVG